MDVNMHNRPIPPELYLDLRRTLLACGPFGSDPELRAVFVDGRIKPWGKQIPGAPDEQARVESLLHCLEDQFTTAGENALVLFLCVLRDRIDPPTNACYARLDALAGALAAIKQPGTGHASPVPRDAPAPGIAQRPPPTGGIHAGKLKAQNVVKGVQIQGDKVPPGLAELLQVTQPPGGITADEIDANNVVDGVQVIPSGNEPTKGDL